MCNCRGRDQSSRTAPPGPRMGAVGVEENITTLGRGLLGLRNLGSGFAELCFPSACDVCAAPVQQGRLYPTCLIELARVESVPSCARCAMPLSEPAAPCARCQGKGRHPFERIARLGLFRDPLRKLIHEMKYH